MDKTDITIESLRPEHLPQLAGLINAHLNAVAPGWVLPETYIADHLRRNPQQPIIDPWVRERLTLVAVTQQRVVAAAHLLRYGNEPEVNPHMRGAGDIAWFIGQPDANNALDKLLVVAHAQCQTWAVTREIAWDAGLPVGPFVGVPDVWPHVADALSRAGFAPDPDRREAIYGGTLDHVAPPQQPPLPDLTLRQSVGRIGGTLWEAVLNGETVGHIEYETDLTRGGAIPALRGWGELFEIEVVEGWRNRGIGAWLVQHAVAWHRLGGGSRVVISVAAENEALGAGRFYTRFGWSALVRQQDGWRKTV